MTFPFDKLESKISIKSILKISEMDKIVSINIKILRYWETVTPKYFSKLKGMFCGIWSVKEKSLFDFINKQGKKP